MIHRLILFYLFAILMSCASSNNEQIAEKVDAATFSKNLESLEGVQLVDVRTPEEFANGSIDNAVNINFYDDAFEEQIANLDKKKPVMIYCQAGTAGGRSGQTLDKLKELGFEEIYELAGGYGGWSKE
ncbi:MAG: rhodanese-like domain-containing protein [Bacteroidota bacterium]